VNERVIVREDFDDEVPLVLVMILVSVSVPILMLILILSRLIAAVPAAALDTNVPRSNLLPQGSRWHEYPQSVQPPSPPSPTSASSSS